MNQKKGFANIILIAITIIIAGVVGFFTFVKKSTPIKNPSIVYAEVKKYRYADISQRIQIYQEVHPLATIVTEKIKSACVSRVLNYFYAFPGYTYEDIDGFIRSEVPYKIAEREINVSLTLQGSGLNSSEIARVGSGKDQGDRYRFTFSYQPNSGNCILVSHAIERSVIPVKIYEFALSSAKKNSRVAKFIRTNSMYDIYSTKWDDGHNTNVFDPGPQEDFTQSVREIIVLRFVNTTHLALYVSVDILSGSVTVSGPYDETPQLID